MSVSSSSETIVLSRKVISSRELVLLSMSQLVLVYWAESLMLLVTLLTERYRDDLLTIGKSYLIVGTSSEC